MKAISFIIHTNILIALAAVALSFATQVLMGLHPQCHIYLFLILFSTLLDYNFHRVAAVYKKPAAAQVEKYKWASEHLSLLKILLIRALAGILVTSVLVETEILYLLIPLALISALYTFAGSKINYFTFRALGITGLKIVIIALVWSVVTVLIPYI